MQTISSLPYEMSVLQILLHDLQWRPKLFDPRGYFRHVLNKQNLHSLENIKMYEYKTQYPHEFEEVRIERRPQGGASLDPPPFPWLDLQCYYFSRIKPRNYVQGLIVFQLMVRRKLIVPNRIWRRYLERREKTLRDLTIKIKLFAFMGINLSRRMQIRKMCAIRIQRAYRAHRILHNTFGFFYG
jgi:hypothetical protein